MKVLITGSTSQQVSENILERTTTFSRVLRDAFKSLNVEVDVQKPSTSLKHKDLEKYDKVFVGISPLFSLSSNYIYPALYVGGIAKELDNLVLFIDGPEPKLIKDSLTTYSLSPESMSKEFYKKRKNYENLKDKNFYKPIQKFLNQLCTDEWPLTVCPSLPWMSDEDVRNQVGTLTKGNSIVINPDTFLIQEKRIKKPQGSDSLYWTCDYHSSLWTKKVEMSLAFPVVRLRSSAREQENSVTQRMLNSVGTLVSTHRSSRAWWSPAVAMSINCSTPVVTDWRSSSALGSDWAHLGSEIEEMSEKEREKLSQRQFCTYRNALMGVDKTSSLLLSTLSDKFSKDF